MGRNELIIPERRLVAFWGSTPHRLIEVGPGTQSAVFTVPLQWFSKWKAPEALVQSVFEGQVAVEPVDATVPSKVDTWIKDIRGNEEHLKVATFLEIQAAFMRMQTQQLPRKVNNFAAIDIEPVMQMCRHISNNLKSDLSSVEIAEVAGLHPNYAMRVFKKFTGMTLQEYVVRQRIASAQRLLLTTTESVEVIGQDAGFQSNSQYYAVFRKYTGLSPLQYRKKNQSSY